MRKSDILNCQFSVWYPEFKHLTFKSKVLDLPTDVAEYLLADGLVLPEGCEDNLQRRDFEGDSDDEVVWDEDTPEATAPKFPEFTEKIKSSIKVLGGQVIPKLNWSAPKDASWITVDNTLKCSCPRDVYMLIKSSDFISHDLTRPFDQCADDTAETVDECIKYQLILRRWHNLNPAGEFRCFVYNNKLIGICQRLHTVYFLSIATDQEKIRTSISKFYSNEIQNKFISCSYVFDVYVTDRKVYLVDFNPYGPVTDSLLFSWDELLCDKPLQLDLNTDCKIKPLFRYVETERNVQPNPYQCYTIPQDFVHLTTGEDPQKLIDFLRMKTQTQGDSSSEDD